MSASSAAPSRSTHDRDRSTVVRSTETKAAFKTTEFYVMLVVLVGILIAGNAIEIEEGGTDYFAADKVWLYVTILASAYMISRGLAKSGSRDPYWEDSGQNHVRTDGDGGVERP